MKKASFIISTLIFTFQLSFAQTDIEKLFRAAKVNDVNSIKELIASGVDVNAKSEYGATALTFAADKNNTESIKILLENGADPNARDYFYQSTPFEWSFYENNVEVIALMIKHGANVKVDWLLPNSVRENQTETVKLLLENGAPGASSCIGIAVRIENAEVLKLLLAEATIEQDKLNSALLTAVGMEKHEYVDMLKHAGAVMPKIKKHDRHIKYAGLYADNDTRLKIKNEDNKMLCSFNGDQFYQLQFDSASIFSFQEYPHIKLAFKVVDENAVSVQLINRANKTTFVRFEEALTKEKQVAFKDNTGEVKEVLNWNSFRGVNASGIADGQFPPARWNGEKNLNLKWKTRIPGLSHACPVTWGDKLFLITALGEDTTAEYRVGLYGDVKPVKDDSKHIWKIYCLDKYKGRIIWEKTGFTGIPRVKRHPKATQANSSPVTNGKYVVALFGSEGMVCYNMNGKEIWRKDLGQLDAGWFFESETQWGHAASPIIYKNTVVVQADRSNKSFIASYDLATGKEVWKTDREEISSWGTPSIYYGKNHHEIITNGTKYIKAYKADTGEELWKLGPNSEITVATPVVYKDMVYVTGGYPPVRPIYAIKPGGKGDISIADSLSASEFIKWRHLKGGTYMPSPIAYEGYFYTMANNGMLTCYDAENGERIYRKSIKSGAVTASLVAADGKIYCTSESNGVVVVKAGREFEIIAKNIVGETCLATPAISDRLFIIRAQNNVYCFSRN
ncbi:outer membrane protein assembly factor BamB family protein [Carboxylicivirga marina]|uniref:PQQ-binding-like beta-propeller repeat protein n=1 Tax=Carboxylicivirga marina TaxID=2800988 RepID=A0ABS1HFR0_9BACT|nr:PQQ-binding-like beta-propeller repeat protein [Carboxylicivirga marina]MBK3516503.1 PQQ-binding-like beta-propeller repeat protein [Carboxylicivirga marina]